MKKSPLLMFTGLACALGTTHAQPAVTVFGVVDLAYSRYSTSGRSLSELSTDANTSSRLGFRGTEDLGGGLKASFWLEAAVAPDSGTGAATNVNNQAPGAATPAGTQGLTFGRKSTVALSGPWGEVRLGRDYVPSFLNLTTSMHPFGTNGVGSAGVLFYPRAAGGTTARTQVRASNSVGYFLPGQLGGFYGQAMVALGENASNAGATKKDGSYTGLRLGYASGALNVAGASGTTRYSTGNYTQTNLGVNYRMGDARLMALWGRNKVGSTHTSAWMLGTQWRVGTGEWRFAHTRLKASGVAGDATHTAVGYVHELSRRTALYGTVAHLRNKGASTAFNLGLPVTTPGGTSRGLEFGLRHSF